MSSATITYIDAIDCRVDFGYDERVKNTIKTLPGATYNNKAWIVPIMHLPILEALFIHIDIDPAVLAAYYDALKRMLQDFAGSEHRQGQLDLHIKELMQKHAKGIEHVTCNWQPKPATHRPMPRPEQPVTQPPLIEDRGLSLFLAGSKNAVKAEAKKAQYNRKRYKKVKTT